MEKLLNRSEAIEILSPFVGRDLRPIAQEYGVTVFKDGKLDKGWAGQTCERILGIGRNCSPVPDGNGFELKAIPLRWKNGRWATKETMAIGMINAVKLVETPFDQSSMWAKLEKLLICAREFVSQDEPRARLLRIASFDFVEPDLIAQICADYETARTVVRTSGFVSLSGKLGVYVQPRTKGPGHGSISRAFYMRTSLLAKVLNLEEQLDNPWNL